MIRLVMRHPVLIGALLLVGSCAQAEQGSLEATTAGTRSDPAVGEVARAANQGLPTRLLPESFGTAEYVAPRGTCADVLRDPDREHVELRLTQQFIRRDQWEQGDTTVTARYAEGIYVVSPAGAYGLAPGELLRVHCARQAATAVLSRSE